MADIVPITEDEFIQIASEEGVPLSLAVPFAMRESSLGRNSSAFIDPRKKAGTGPFKNVKSEGIGLGTMQVIKPTYERLMPGKSYEAATDADLTRAGMKLLKSLMNADDTFDWGKVKRGYFGAREDPGITIARNKRDENGNLIPYIPSTDPEIDRSLRSIAWNVENKLVEGKSLYEIASGKVPPNVKLDESAVQSQIAAKTAEAEKLINFDPVAAQATYNEAASLETARLRAILDERQAKQNTIRDLAGTNPYGVFAEAQATFDALKDANERLRQTISDRNFQTLPANDGLLGFLEYFGRKIAADENYDKRVKEVTDLQKAASDYQTVLSQLQGTSEKGDASLADEINIANASRAAGNSALKFDLKALEIEGKNANIQLRNLQTQNLENEREFRRKLSENTAATKESQFVQNLKYKYQALGVTEARHEQLAAEATTRLAMSAKRDSDRRAYQDAQLDLATRRVKVAEDRLALAQEIYEKSGDMRALEEAKLSLQNAKLAQSLVKDLGTSDISALSQAANAVLNTPGQVWKASELNTVIRGDPEIGKKIAAYLTSGGDEAALRNKDVGANLLSLSSTGTPAERAQADKLLSAYSEEVSLAKSALSGNKYTMLEGKAKDSIDAAAAERAKTILGGRTTPETRFSDNPINAFPQADYIKIAGKQGGLDKIVEKSGLDMSRMDGDANLITSLLYAQRAGKITETPAELRDALLSYYQELAKVRSGIGDKESVVYKANIPVSPEMYIIQTSKGVKYDLTTSAGLLTYLQRVGTLANPARPQQGYQPSALDTILFSGKFGAQQDIRDAYKDLGQ